MGCGNPAKSYSESCIKEMWKQTPIKSKELLNSFLINLFEKATAYKRDLRNHQEFCTYILNPLLINPAVINNEIEFFKNNYLDVTKGHSFEIPFALLFLTYSKDYLDLYKNFRDLYTLIDGRMDNEKKLKENIPSLKIILTFYICLISIFSLESCSMLDGNKNNQYVDETLKIYSISNLKRHVNKIFNFEKNINMSVYAEKEIEYFNKNNLEKTETFEILHFFKLNYDKLKPQYIRDCLFEYELTGCNSEEAIKKYEEEQQQENQDFPNRKSKVVKKIVKKKKNYAEENLANEIQN